MEIVYLAATGAVMYQLGYLRIKWLICVADVAACMGAVVYNDGAVNSFVLLVPCVAFGALFVGIFKREERDYALLHDQEELERTKLERNLRRLGVDPYRPLREDEK